MTHQDNKVKRVFDYYLSYLTMFDLQQLEDLLEDFVMYK